MAAEIKGKGKVVQPHIACDKALSPLDFRLQIEYRKCACQLAGHVEETFKRLTWQRGFQKIMCPATMNPS